MWNANSVEPGSILEPQRGLPRAALDICCAVVAALGRLGRAPAHDALPLLIPRESPK